VKLVHLVGFITKKQNTIFLNNHSGGSRHDICGRTYRNVKILLEKRLTRELGPTVSCKATKRFYIYVSA